MGLAASDESGGELHYTVDWPTTEAIRDMVDTGEQNPATATLPATGLPIESAEHSFVAGCSGATDDPSARLRDPMAARSIAVGDLLELFPPSAVDLLLSFVGGGLEPGDNSSGSFCGVIGEIGEPRGRPLHEGFESFIHVANELRAHQRETLLTGLCNTFHDA